jgi:hypothetical protein
MSFLNPLITLLYPWIDTPYRFIWVLGKNQLKIMGTILDSSIPSLAKSDITQTEFRNSLPLGRKTWVLPYICCWPPLAWHSNFTLWILSSFDTTKMGHRLNLHCVLEILMKYRFCPWLHVLPHNSGKGIFIIITFATWQNADFMCKWWYNVLRNKRIEAY